MGSIIPSLLHVTSFENCFLTKHICKCILKPFVGFRSQWCRNPSHMGEVSLTRALGDFIKGALRICSSQVVYASVRQPNVCPCFKPDKQPKIFWMAFQADPHDQVVLMTLPWTEFGFLREADFVSAPETRCTCNCSRARKSLAHSWLPNPPRNWKMAFKV